MVRDSPMPASAPRVRAAWPEIEVVGSVFGTWGLVPVLTGSMRPGIRPGDLVLVVPEPVRDVKVGQILDFQPPGEGGASVTHRVISVRFGAGGPVIRTKGDANNVADSWHAQLPGATAWRVRAVIPKLGYLAVAEHNPTGRLAVEMALMVAAMGLGLSVIWGRSTGPPVGTDPFTHPSTGTDPPIGSDPFLTGGAQGGEHLSPGVAAG